MKTFLMFLVWFNLLLVELFGQTSTTTIPNPLLNDYKVNCRVASTANVADLVGTANDLEVGDTIDGVTLVAGDRVLLKNQTTTSENGIWLVSGESLAPARASDCASWVQLPGSVVVVTAGTVNSNTVWLNTSAATGTVGSTAVSYVKIAPSASLISLITDANTSVAYNPTADTDAARGVALTNAVAAAVAGDTIRLGAGTYNIAAAITVADGVAIVGAGASTVITSSVADILVKPGANNTVTGIKIVSVGSSACYGWNDPDDAKTGIRLVDVTMSGDTDVLIMHDTVTPTNPTSATFVGCRFISSWVSGAGANTDAVRLSASAGDGYDFSSCEITANGASTKSEAQGIHIDSGTARFRNCRIHVQGGTTTNHAIHNSGATVHLNGCIITSSGAGTLLDIKNASGSMTVSGCGYDATKTTGTITNGEGISGTLFASGIIKVSTQALSGAGAANLTTTATKVTTTGASQSVTLGNGVDGQIKVIIHDVDGGDFTLTASTMSGWTAWDSTTAGESITLMYVTARGWVIIAYIGGLLS